MAQLNHARYVPFIAKATALGAALGALAPALVITILTGLPNGSLLHPIDVAETVLLLLPITAVSCGPFGLIAAFVGGSAVFLRRRRIRSGKRLLIESGIAGFLLGCLFPFFDLAENSVLVKERPQLMVIPIQLLFYPILGVLCAIVCALALRKYFISQNRQSPAK